jgi:hypothetical protein
MLYNQFFPVPIIAVSVQYGVYDYRIILQSEEDPRVQPRITPHERVS